MAVFKCKMCGGNLDVCEGVTVCECEYCGTKQTVPTLDNEKKISLFSRANRLRFACEFDKAAGIYESIVAEFPEEAEAYWGLVLCKYGIEYVDDPLTAKKIPTCHRSSFESVMDNNNFEMALEYSVGASRTLYREEAKQIEELRKAIIEVSSKEDPYDIFICYKETAENGDRTLDSVIAQDVYDALCEKGYRVFFSRITLEDKLGQEYEPYIFAALNSAKIMLAFGTDYEYYNAIWVKNEWSRFLELIAKGEKKTLIPCYKNIDAYDMPKEFAKLQAQDMGKVGAIQDLLRGIEKILDPSANKEKVVIQQQNNPEQQIIDSLTQKSFVFIKEGDYKSASLCLDNLYTYDSQNPMFYIGKLLVEYKCSEIDDLKKINISILENENFKKAVKFSNDELNNKLELLGAYTFYNNQNKKFQSAVNSSSCNEIIKSLEQIDFQKFEYTDKEFVNLIENLIVETKNKKEKFITRAKRIKKTIIISLSSIITLIIIISTALGIYDNVIVPKKFLQEFKQAKVGDTVKFGVYEQDNDITNGKEYIEWIVLDRQGDKALLISKYVLDCEVFGETTWDNSTIRTWLNDTFLNDAFGGRSDTLILTTKVEAHKNPYAEWSTGSSTKDKIFLLSIDEAKKYFADDESRISGITEYSKAKGVFGSKENGGAWWWLRTSSKHAEFVAYVSYDGSICNGGCDGLSDDVGIRPAMWIDLSKVK